MKYGASRCIFLAATILAALSGLASARGSQDRASAVDPTAKVPKGVLKISVAHNASIEGSWQKASLKFADTVKSRGGGRFNVEIFGNGVLSQRNWQVLFDSTQSTAGQIGIENISELGARMSRISAFNLPFLFSDLDHAARFLDSEPSVWKAWLNEEFEEKRLVVLAVSLRPFRQLSDRERMVKNLRDIDSRKIRVPAGRIFAKIYESFGAVPVPLPPGEICDALRSGIIDGSDESVSARFDYRTYEPAKNITLWNCSADASVMFMNRKTYNELTQAEKDLFKEAGKEWAALGFKEERTISAKAMAEMERSGAKFYEMTETEKAAFKDAARTVYEDFAKQAGTEKWNAFLDAVGRTRKRG